VYGHGSPSGMREELFYELQKYEEVVSPGSYLNNMIIKNGAHGRENMKYVKLSIFTIAGDSIHYSGFVTKSCLAIHFLLNTNLCWKH